MIKNSNHDDSVHYDDGNNDDDDGDNEDDDDHDHYHDHYDKDNDKDNGNAKLQSFQLLYNQIKHVIGEY